MTFFIITDTMLRVRNNLRSGDNCSTPKNSIEVHLVDEEEKKLRALEAFIPRLMIRYDRDWISDSLLDLALLMSNSLGYRFFTYRKFLELCLRNEVNWNRWRNQKRTEILDETNLMHSFFDQWNWYYCLHNSCLNVSYLSEGTCIADEEDLLFLIVRTGTNDDTDLSQSYPLCRNLDFYCFYK